MNAMIAKYLKDFSVPAPAEAAGSDLIDSLAATSFNDFDFADDPLPGADIDIDAERRESYEQGFRAASEEAEARHSQQQQADAEAHTAEIELLAAEHEQESLGMIHRRFHEMTQALSQSLAEQTLQVLLPVFEEEFCRRSVSALAEQVRETMQDATVATVVVKGPAALGAKLKLLLDADGIDSRFIEAATLDITVEIDDTVLVTRLAAWAQSVAEVTR